MSALHSYLLTLCLAASIASAQTQNPEAAIPNKDILERLDKLEKQNADLLEEIKSLRQLVANTPPAADRQDVSEHRIEEQAQTKVEASQRFPIQLTGMALFNAFTNGTYAGASQNPVVASLRAGPAESGGSLRQTVLGITFQGPETFWGGKTSGSLYMDFFAGTSQYSDHLLRLRLATFQIDWKNTTFSLGQDKPVVSRREPNSLAQVGVSPLTAAGDPWLWQPQARIEQRFALSHSTSIRAEAGIIQTDEAGVQAPNVANALEEARPAFEARVAVSHKFSEERVVEIAPVFHTSTSHILGMSVPSRLFGVDWLVKPNAKVEITGLFFSGSNFANIGGLGGITLLSPAVPIGIHDIGGWTQIRYLATRKLSFDLYGGQEDDRNSDLSAGVISKNQYYAGNVMYMLGPNVMTSFEVGHLITTYLGNGDRSNNHYDLALAYLF